MAAVPAGTGRQRRGHGAELRRGRPGWPRMPLPGTPAAERVRQPVPHPRRRPGLHGQTRGAARPRPTTGCTHRLARPLHRVRADGQTPGTPPGADEPDEPRTNRPVVLSHRSATIAAVGRRGRDPRAALPRQPGQQRVHREQHDHPTHAQRERQRDALAGPRVDLGADEQRLADPDGQLGRRDDERGVQRRQPAARPRIAGQPGQVGAGEAQGARLLPRRRDRPVRPGDGAGGAAVPGRGGVTGDAASTVGQHTDSRSRRPAQARTALRPANQVRSG